MNRIKTKAKGSNSKCWASKNLQLKRTKNNTFWFLFTLYITNQPLTDTHIPGFLRMAEREAAPPWAKSRSCMTRRCRSSNSCLNSLASAAISAGSVGICESSMSLRTCCRSWGGNMLMKVAGSVSTPWLPCCCCWIRCCSTRCCWSTCCMTFHKRMSAPMYRNKGNVSWINK